MPEPKVLGAKEMKIDFKIRDDLTLTTLKEFFDILISSVKMDMLFHSELLSDHYQYIGLNLSFNRSEGSATLIIMMAHSVEAQ